jgi:5S rRNA maturation endonuclease (ribonuclease M5)
MKTFSRTHWGKIKQFQLPCTLFQPTIAVPHCLLAVLLVMYETVRKVNMNHSQRFAEVHINQKLMVERTGFSRNSVSKAICELETRKFIQVESYRKKRGEFGVNRYLICNPATGQPYNVQPGERLLFSNHVAYFNFPVCIVREVKANWSVAKMSSSELVAFLFLALLANQNRTPLLEIEPAIARQKCDLSRTTFIKALNGLEERGLISIGDFETALRDPHLEINLHDPYTGEKLHKFSPDPKDNPANYHDKETGKRVNLNNAEYAEKAVLSALPANSDIVWQTNGDFKIRCPFVAETDPSCSVSPKKRCFYCFGCERKGTITELLMQLRHTTKAGAIEHLSLSAGVRLEYHNPDKEADAIYSWREKDGRLIKQNLRLPGKRFVQRRLIATGWIYNLDGVKPMLYNADKLEYASTICIVEGEKDADRMNSLQLHDSYGVQIQTTTSGGANSWHDPLADRFAGKRVIVMFDADEAGKKYRDQVVASLEKRGIDYRIVSFEDAGAKDVSEFLDCHVVEELQERIGDWAVDPMALKVPTVL